MKLDFIKIIALGFVSGMSIQAHAQIQSSSLVKIKNPTFGHSQARLTSQSNLDGVCKSYGFEKAGSYYKIARSGHTRTDEVAFVLDDKGQIIGSSETRDAVLEEVTCSGKLNKKLDIQAAIITNPRSTDELNSLYTFTSLMDKGLITSSADGICKSQGYKMAAPGSSRVANTKEQTITVDDNGNVIGSYKGVYTYRIACLYGEDVLEVSERKMTDVNGVISNPIHPDSGLPFSSNLLSKYYKPSDPEGVCKTLKYNNYVQGSAKSIDGEYKSVQVLKDGNLGTSVDSYILSEIQCANKMDDIAYEIMNLEKSVLIKNPVDPDYNLPFAQVSYNRRWEWADLNGVCKRLGHLRFAGGKNNYSDPMVETIKIDSNGNVIGIVEGSPITQIVCATK